MNKAIKREIDEWKEWFDELKFILIPVFTITGVLWTLTLFLIINFNYGGTTGGCSMYPTYSCETKDVLAIKKDSLMFKIKKNDIISFTYKEYVLGKRVIGMPGDTIEIKNEIVYLNDNVLVEEYIPNNLRAINYALFGTYNGYGTEDGLYPRQTLNEDEYFMMGDNRSGSADSRKIGPVKLENIFDKNIIKFES